MNSYKYGPQIVRLHHSNMSSYTLKNMLGEMEDDYTL